MDDNIEVLSERVDDIPLLLGELDRMGVSEILDTHFPPHGNWKGLSLGKVSSIWLSHILSEGDHRLNHLEKWASYRVKTLSRCVGKNVNRLDFTDDRLASILSSLSNEAQWDECERSLTRNTLRVYDLDIDTIRLDSTSASGYWNVSEDGLFQFGYSKDHRGDLPQLKVMLSSLDPLGMPICCEVISGERADDPLYIPAIRKVQESFDRKGLLYIGDCKMASLNTRAYIASSGDSYLCPLPKVQLNDEQFQNYLQVVFNGEQALTPIYRKKSETESAKIAEGYESCEVMSAQIDEKTITWQERRLIVRSIKLAKSAKKTLDQRIAQTMEKLLVFNEVKQGRKRYHSQEELQPKVEEILQESQLQQLLQVEYHQSGQIRPLRRYKDKPQQYTDERVIRISVSKNEEVYNKMLQSLGWRVYATNTREEYLLIDKAVLAYRNEFIIEGGFKRFKGKPLSLTPIYLQDENRVRGLVRLLSIALKVLTLMEYQVRCKLAKQQRKLSGLYKGNPKRATDNPTTQQMLKTFEYITLTIIDQHVQTIYHLTQLNEVQSKIIELLGLNNDIYTRLTVQFQKPG